MKITKRQLRRIIKEAILAETLPTFGLRTGDLVRHKYETDLGVGKVVAKSNKRDRTVLVKWDTGQQRHDPASLVLNEIKALKRLFSKPAGNKITVKNPTPGGSDLELPEEIYATIGEVNPALASAIDAVNAGTPRSTDRYKVRGQWPRLVKFSTMEPVEIKSLFGSLDVDYMIAQIKDKSEIMDWNIHKQEGPLGRQHNIMLVKRPTQEQMKFGVVDPFWTFDNAGISDPKARGSVWVPKRFSQKFEHTRGQWTGPLYAYVWSSGDRQYGKGGYTWHILDNNNTNLMILTSRGEWASPAAAVKSMKREFFAKFETNLR